MSAYTDWVAAGRPWRVAKPIEQLRLTLRGHGMTVYTIGNETHLTANPPEDHTPYSATGWPGTHPYPYVLACDIMPHASIDWVELGHQLIRDWRASVPGTEWIKYVNWTDRDGRCWHTEKQPTFTQTVSTDRGHIHISGRTDYVNSTTAAYDPVARMKGETMTPEEVWAHEFGSASLNVSSRAASDWLKAAEATSRKVDALAARVELILVAVTALTTGATQLDPAAVAGEVVRQLPDLVFRAVTDE